MEQILKIGSMINQKRLPDEQTNEAFEFLKSLPALEGQLDTLKKTQFKMCLDKIKFKMFE